jgi:hypothetical protein
VQCLRELCDGLKSSDRRPFGSAERLLALAHRSSSPVFRALTGEDLRYSGAPPGLLTASHEPLALSQRTTNTAG